MNSTGPGFQADVCLNDGSSYPRLVALLRGQAFAWGFITKLCCREIQIPGKIWVELNGYKWNLWYSCWHTKWRIVCSLTNSGFGNQIQLPIFPIGNGKVTLNMFPAQRRPARPLQQYSTVSCYRRSRLGNQICRQHNCAKGILRLLDFGTILPRYQRWLTANFLQTLQVNKQPGNQWWHGLPTGIKLSTANEHLAESYSQSCFS